MHLAFVNTSNSSGMVRFSEIGIGATPVKCNGFIAVLTADDCSERWELRILTKLCNSHLSEP